MVFIGFIVGLVWFYRLLLFWCFFILGLTKVLFLNTFFSRVLKQIQVWDGLLGGGKDFFTAGRCGCGEDS